VRSQCHSSNYSIQQFVADRVEADEYKDVLRVCHQYYQTDPFRWTWGEFNNWNDAWARGIIAARMKKGDRFVVSLANDPELIVTDFAAARIGVNLVSLSPTAPVEEVAASFDYHNPRSVMVMDQYKGEWRTDVIRKIIPEVVDLDEGLLLKSFRYSNIRTLIHTGHHRSHGFVQFRDLYLKNPLSDPLKKISVSGDEAALSVLSPEGKWLNISQSELLQSAKNFANGVGLTRDDRVHVNIPLYSVPGKVAGLYGVLTNLSCLIIPGRSFDSGEAIKTLKEEICSVLLVTTDQLKSILADPQIKSENFEHLEKVVVVDDPSSLPSNDLLTEAKTTFRVSDVKVASISYNGTVSIV